MTYVKLYGYSKGHSLDRVDYDIKYYKQILKELEARKKELLIDAKYGHITSSKQAVKELAS